MLKFINLLNFFIFKRKVREEGVKNAVKFSDKFSITHRYLLGGFPKIEGSWYFKVQAPGDEQSGKSDHKNGVKFSHNGFKPDTHHTARQGNHQHQRDGSQPKKGHIGNALFQGSHGNRPYDGQVNQSAGQKTV